MKSYTRRILALLVLLMVAPGVAGQDGPDAVIDPSGLYVRVSSFMSQPVEWYQIIPEDQQANRYFISDWFGDGFSALIDEDGAITLDEGGTGAFSSPDQAQFSPLSGSPSLVDLRRGPRTTADFPLTQERMLPVDPLLADDWDIFEQNLNLVTGEAIPPDFVDVFTLQVVDESLRFTDSAGIFFQGAMDQRDRALFRYLAGTRSVGLSPPFASYPGSRNNFQRDIVGLATFPDINHFSVVLALQSRETRPDLRFLLTIEGERRDPLPEGDVNGDRTVTTADRNLLSAQIGADVLDAQYSLAADLDHNGVVDARDRSLFDGENIAEYAITPAISGSWFDPLHSGEGWNLIVLDDRRVLVTWFSYRPDGGDQAWFIGVGEIQGNEILLPDMLIPAGTTFGPEFDPDEVINAPWGRARIWFESCTRGGISWNSEAGFPRGGLRLNRLSRIGGLPCEGEAEPPDAARYSGHWFDPLHSGEGWLVEILEDGSPLVYWFTYDDNAEQFWMVGQGEIIDDAVVVEEMLYTRGATFGDDFDPADVQRIPWGRLEFRLTGCRQGVLDYESLLPGFGSGSLNPRLLAPYASLPRGCQD